jgi:hypothetical protein
MKTHPPTHFESKILKARSLHAKRSYNKALDAYRETLFTEDDKPRYQFVYAKLLKDDDQFIPADSLFTQLHDRYSSKPVFSYQLRLTKAEQGSKSIDIFYLKALQQDPSHQAAAYALAKYYFKIHSFKYHHQLAKVYSVLKDFESAESHAQLSIGLKDTSLDQERFTLALAKIMQDKLKEGIQLLKLAI